MGSPESLQHYLSEEQKSQFWRRGYCVIEGAFSLETAEVMEQALFEFAETRLSLRRSRPDGWKGVGASSFAPLERSGVFDATYSPLVAGCLNDLLGGAGWSRGRSIHPLVTFPQPEARWLVPARGWHSDFPVTTTLFAVRVFAYLVDVEVGGGGTLVVAGSHLVSQRLVEENPGTSSNSSRVKRALSSRFAWFSELMGGEVEDVERTRRLMQETEDILGVPVRVVELAQRAGDVVLWHPNLLHAASPNVRATPRVMLVSTAVRNREDGTTA